MEKAVVSYVLVVWYLFATQTGYGVGDMSPWHHLLSMVSHAGLWHLAGNLFVVWIIRNRMYLLASLAIAFVATFMPVVGLLWPMDGVTMGFSGVIFAVFGVKWGIYCQSFWPGGKAIMREAMWEFCCKAVPFALVGALIPHVNWCLHLYCLLGGFAYGRWRWKCFLR